MKEKLLAPTDALTLTIFRVALALGIVLDAIKSLMTLPETRAAFKPKYFGFEWVELGALDQGLLYVAIVLAVILMSGYLSRVIAPVLFLVWTAFWLDDYTRHNNHYFMTTFVLFVFSIFGSGGPLHQIKRQVSYTPFYVLLLIQLQICIVYFFGGIAKLHPDWLSGNIATSIFDRFENKKPQQLIYFITWGGVILDLACPFGLMIRKTRLVTFVFVTGFHISNMFIFGMQIGGFPYMMTVASVVFFSPEIIRKIFRLKLNAGTQAEGAGESEGKPSAMPEFRYGLQFYIGVLYLLIQVVMPLRYWIYPGDVLWHRHGLFLTWRMMMSTYVYDEKYAPKFRISTEDGQYTDFYLAKELGGMRAWKINAYPDLIHQYALKVERRIKAEKKLRSQDLCPCLRQIKRPADAETDRSECRLDRTA